MQSLKKYLENTLGIDMSFSPLPDREIQKLPLYLRAIYSFYLTSLFERKLLLLTVLQKLTPEQYRKHILIIENVFQLPAVFVFDSLKPYERKRLIEKQVAFIIPDKQMFIPQLLIDLKEFRNTQVKSTEKLSPVAQYLLLYHLQKENLSGKNLKEIALLLKYSSMSISRAIKNLQEKELCTVDKGKNKEPVFIENKKELFKKAQAYFQTPVRKVVAANTLNEAFLKSGDTALSYYTNLSSIDKDTFAISPENFKYLQKQNKITFVPPDEGEYNVEVWKYPPEMLTNSEYVDILSLYLIFQSDADERIQIELDKIIDELW